MKKLVIMSGGFHPFHPGHYALYQAAQRAFPDAKVIVGATNVQEKRPFPFEIKQALAQLMGVPRQDFVQVDKQFSVEPEAIQRVVRSLGGPENVSVIYVRSDKDKNKNPMPPAVDPATGQLPLVTRGPRKGQPVSDYLKYYQDDQPLDPVIKHAYMAYLPVQEFGPGMKSATEIRTVWPELNDGQKSGLVQVLYPATRKNSKLTQTVKKLLDAGIQPQTNEDYLEEKWSTKYKRSIDCSHPRGFSQRAHCAGRKK